MLVQQRELWPASGGEAQIGGQGTGELLLPWRSSISLLCLQVARHYNTGDKTYLSPLDCVTYSSVSGEARVIGIQDILFENLCSAKMME
ncbi:hypothetical protein EON65_21810 [archaeon]|nr:MAG: hypothetical protein EON65_21810 [archaeon]